MFSEEISFRISAETIFRQNILSYVPEIIHMKKEFLSIFYKFSIFTFESGDVFKLCEFSAVLAPFLSFVFLPS